MRTSIRRSKGRLRGRFYNAGQICTAVKRLFLHEKIADVFMQKLTAKLDGMKVGNGLLPHIDMGPLNSSEQLARTVSAVATTREREEGNRPLRRVQAYRHRVR